MVTGEVVDAALPTGYLLYQITGPWSIWWAVRCTNSVGWPVGHLDGKMWEAVGQIKYVWNLEAEEFHHKWRENTQCSCYRGKSWLFISLYCLITFWLKKSYSIHKVLKNVCLIKKKKKNVSTKMLHIPKKKTAETDPRSHTPGRKVKWHSRDVAGGLCFTLLLFFKGLFLHHFTWF